MKKSRPPKDTTETFGARLARLRKAAGLTQQALGDEVGLSQRMMAYYETQAAFPPTAKKLPELAKALGVSTDVMLGIEHAPARQLDAPLQRRLRELARLPPKERRQILRLIDSLLEAERIKQRAG